MALNLQRREPSETNEGEVTNDREGEGRERLGEEAVVSQK